MGETDSRRISYDEALSVLDGVKRYSGHAMALSPFRTETEPSLKLTPTADGFLAIDHGDPGWNGDRFKDLVVLLRDRLGRDGDKRPPPKRKQTKAATPKKPKQSLPPWEVTAVYAYVDEAGDKLFEAVRQERTVNGERKKRFQLRHEKAGQFVYKLGSIPRVLYRLDEILADPSAPVWVCEGEKDADNLRQFGFVATTNPMGAGKWLPLHTEALRGRDVIILKDYDKTGFEHAEAVAFALHGVAKQVRVPELPGLEYRPSHGPDVSDWIHEHKHGREDLLHVLGETPPWQPVRLAEVVAEYRRFMHLPDLTPLLAVLATYATHQMEGDRVWLLLVAPPSGGKTEILHGLFELPDIYKVGTLTEASLISGTATKDKIAKATGGLLFEIGNGGRGMLVCKDFGSVLSMPGEGRASTLAALREVYDGGYAKAVGSDGGKNLKWEGEVGFLGATTTAIDTYSAVLATLGDRFLLCRLPRDDDRIATRRALMMTGKERQQRKRVMETVARFFAHLQLPDPPGEDEPPFDDETAERLSWLAEVISRSRSPVVRDGYSREVEFIPVSEAAPRLAKQLGRLLIGLDVIGDPREDGGDPREDSWRIVERVAKDCIPANRRKVIEYLHAQGDDWTLVSSVATGAGWTSRKYAERLLEDLSFHRVTEADDRGPESNLPRVWRLTKDIREHYPAGETDR